jgi:hypothetical protein
MLNLSESDLRFLVESVANSRRDYDHIVNLIRGKEDLLEPMLEDPKLLERLFHDQETFILSAPAFLGAPPSGAKGIGKGGVCPRAGLQGETNPGL